MMYGFNDYGWGGLMNGFTGGIMMLAFWILLIVFIVWIVREISGRSGGGSGNSGGSSGSGGSNSRALEILKERYAKGEITKEEFEAKKRDITS